MFLTLAAPFWSIKQVLCLVYRHRFLPSNRQHLFLFFHQLEVPVFDTHKPPPFARNQPPTYWGQLDFAALLVLYSANSSLLIRQRRNLLEKNSKHHSLHVIWRTPVLLFLCQFDNPVIAQGKLQALHNFNRNFWKPLLCTTPRSPASSSIRHWWFR